MRPAIAAALFLAAIVGAGAQTITTGIIAIDGDTVIAGGRHVRLVGFDTAERGELAKCDRERDLAARAARRLESIIAGGDIALQLVPCSCRASTEGTMLCNHGRACGVLTWRGRDVGELLIAEGLAHPYQCAATHCPRRPIWCG